MIPKLIHQTWKTGDVPRKWRRFADTVREMNPGWEYRLWTDADNDEFVRREYPEFYEIFTGFSRGIMRADVIRYLIMFKIGGVYLDLDYEVLRPFDFGDCRVVLPMNRSRAFGDPSNELGNCIFASVPGHRFWYDVIEDLRTNPPAVSEYTQIVEATGPRLLTRIYNSNNYPDICVPERLVYHPPSPHGRKEIEQIRNNGISLGIHHLWGSWKERWSLAYLKNKYRKNFRKSQEATPTKHDNPSSE